MTRFHTLLARVAACAAIAAASAFSASDAGAQQVSACYTNKNGTMYRVGVAGTPTDCTNATHKKDTWNVQGAPGVSEYAVEQAQYAVPVGAGISSFQYQCPAGRRALSVGWNLPQSSTEFTIDVLAHRPVNEGTSWIFRVKNKEATVQTLSVWVICAVVQTAAAPPAP